MKSKIRRKSRIVRMIFMFVRNIFPMNSDILVIVMQSLAIKCFLLIPEDRIPLYIFSIMRKVNPEGIEYF